MRNTLPCMENVCCHYMSSYIMENKYFHYTSLVYQIIHFHVSRNVCCYYISSYIMKNKYCHYTSSNVTKRYFHVSRNICCYYT